MIGAGVAYYYGKQMLEAPGPLQEDKIVNIPRARRHDATSPTCCSAKA